RSQDAERRAGGVARDGEVGRAGAALRERALPEHDPLHRRERLEYRARVEVEVGAGFELRQEGEAPGLAGRGARLAGKGDIAGDRWVVGGGADRRLHVPASRRVARIRRDRERVGDAAAGDAARIETAVRVAEGDARQQGGIEAALHTAGEPGRAGVE